MTEPKPARAPTEKEAFFFLTIMQCMTNKPEVDWNLVATRAGYSNAVCAKTRFGQIKKQIGYKEDGSHATPSPIKGRAKNDVTIGSGTNTTSTKVTKTRAPRKPKAAKVKSEPKPEPEDEEQDEEMIKEELEQTVENEAGAYIFDDPIHEQLFKSYQVGKYEDEADLEEAI
ncbi:hypothetical protein BKA65DRAFT_590094 [Rhexocercosporidium sp. MPI-PUGE-AT-0058]|nr:hypothetical protein BKA65DRAFT_590094 [Rhexocercosporidium sp. MPI-PUGE-AT-0058]